MGRFLANLLLFGLAAQPACAALGGPADVLTDNAAGVPASVRLSASTLPTVLPIVSVRQTVFDDGILVKEYSEPAGIVFAVAWQGPAMLDMKTLLGSYFMGFKSASDLPGQPRVLGGSVQFERQGLVVRSSGRMRAFAGIALAADLVPVGVSADDLVHQSY